jgi:oxygen-independent coproporphyrinogen-3 oxidase
MATVRNVADLKPDHLSCYGLKVEEGTRLWEYKEGANLPDDDAQADMYFYAVETLESLGYQQYEISNFSRPGMECRHNLKYWSGEPYLGFGPAAASDFAGKRFTAEADLNRYISGILEHGTVLSQCESVPMRERAGEYLMLRLRTRYGIEQHEYQRTYLLPFAPLEELLQRYREQELATMDENGRWRLTPKGFMVSNTLLVELLDAQQESKPLANVR